MGLTKTAWKATWRGHAVDIRRSELTRGFTVEVGGQVAVSRPMTMTGGGHWEGDLAIDGRSVHVILELVGHSECELVIDGEKLAITQVA